MSGDSGGAVGSSDTSTTTETVTATNLGAGDYDVLACGFVNSLPQDYSGSLTMHTVAVSGTGSLPSADPQGLQFSAAVPADPQRDEAEPLIVSDKAGLLYTCGPTGFSQSADYAQVSTDGGDQFHLLGTPPRGQQAVGGGGDCVVSTGEAKNSAGNYQYAYAGLGALSGFTTATSPDNGHTLTPGGFDIAGGVTTDGGGADRQWQTFTDASTVLLSYNQQQPRNVVVVKSTDGGQTLLAGRLGCGAEPRLPGPDALHPVDPHGRHAVDEGRDRSTSPSPRTTARRGPTARSRRRPAAPPASRPRTSTRPGTSTSRGRTRRTTTRGSQRCPRPT